MIAPAKLNLCLYLGPPRPDGLHELRSLFCPLALADRITVSEAERDEVVCPGVEGENLAGRALEELRAAGWEGPPVRVTIDKRIPVAAGLGGGSADAAAVLRLARGQVEGLEQIAAALGADVPSQLDPRSALVSGAGERVEPLPEPAQLGVVLFPSDRGLETGTVFAEADRLGLGREADELERIGERLREAAGPGGSPLGYAELLVNDLEPAALSLRPEIGDALAALRRAGAERTLLCGSGPTAAGLFADLGRAGAAVESLTAQFGEVIATSTAARS